MKKLLASLTLFLSIATCVHGQNTPIVGWDGHLFPSFLISNAAVKLDTEASDETIMGDQTGEVGIEVVAPSDNVLVKIVVRCDAFIETSEFIGTLPTEGTSYRVNPKIRYRYDRLSACKQATPATMTFSIQIGDEPEVTESATFTMHAVNDCPFKLIVGDETFDISQTFAAYVNEQHPFTDKLLREALDRGIVPSFSGYQGDAGQVLREVYAIWDLLVARDVRYSSITATAANSSMVACQHVRLLEESINNSQTNCVDGSVLMVSLLRKIGINASLVLTSNHCYLVFTADNEGTLFYAIETTLTGVAVEEPETIPRDLDQAVEEELRYEESWPSFVTALLVGAQRFEEDGQKAEADSTQEFSIINIASARDLGILPIAFNGKEEFIPIGIEAGEGDVDPKSKENEMDESDEEDSDEV